MKYLKKKQSIKSLETKTNFASRMKHQRFQWFNYRFCSFFIFFQWFDFQIFFLKNFVHFSQKNAISVLINEKWRHSKKSLAKIQNKFFSVFEFCRLNSEVWILQEKIFDANLKISQIQVFFNFNFLKLCFRRNVVVCSTKSINFFCENCGIGSVKRCQY